MIELVTLEEAKLQLRITDDAHDDDLNMKIKAASAAVVNYLHGTRNLYQPMLDSNGDFVTDNDGYYVADPGDSDGPQVREEVKAATLILLTDMFEKRAGAQAEGAGTVAAAYLMAMPAAAMSLLYPLRDPVIR